MPAPVRERRDAPDPPRRDLFRLDRARRCARRWRRSARDGIDLDMLRVRAFPFADEVATSSSRTTASSWSSRTATRSCGRCSSTSARIDPARLISVLHYDGTPITARFIVDEIVRARWALLTGAAAARRRPNDLSRQSPSSTTRSCRRTRSASPAATTRARCRRCAPAAATIRSRRAIIQACFELDAAAASRGEALRHRLLVEDADLLPRREPRLQHACTAACRRC